MGNVIPPPPIPPPPPIEPPEPPVPPPPEPPFPPFPPPEPPEPPLPEPPPECEIEATLHYGHSAYSPVNLCETQSCLELCLPLLGQYYFGYAPSCEACMYPVWSLTRCSCHYYPETQMVFWDCYYDFIGCSPDGVLLPPTFSSDDYNAFKLAHTFGFMPSLTGKYEPVDIIDSDSKLMILADWKDGSNIVFKFDNL